MEKLNCWVYGEDVENILPVNISSSETVYDLKEIIKNKNSNSTPFAFLTMSNWKANLVGGIIQR
ncbi:hypothetical protein SERLA73DRAFT_148342, partial [Serpula lacrymans var. lacrymans S7.3]